MGRKLFLKVGRGDAELRKPVLPRTEEQRSAGRNQPVVYIHDSRYGFHDMLGFCRHALQRLVIVPENLHLDGLRGTHQIAKQVGDTLSETDGHQRHGLGNLPPQVADDFRSTGLAVCLQLNQIVPEIRGACLERHAEGRAARISLHVWMCHDNAFHLAAKPVGFFNVRSGRRVIVEHDRTLV